MKTQNKQQMNRTTDLLQELKDMRKYHEGNLNLKHRSVNQLLSDASYAREIEAKEQYIKGRLDVLKDEKERIEKWQVNSKYNSYYWLCNEFEIRLQEITKEIKLIEEGVGE